MSSTEPDPEVLPRAMRALWGVADEGRRGPKPGMSVRAIAAAGVHIADRDGLDAVSMAAVAKSLGNTAMSLYRYLDSKSALHDVMVDEAVGPPPTVNRRRGWRGQLEEWARADALGLSQHPWVLDVRLGSPPVGPNLVGWMEVGMAILQRTALSHQQVASSLLIVDGFVRNHVTLGLRFSSAAAASWPAQVRSVLDAEQFPAVTAALESGVFEDDTEMGEFPGDEFEFGLALLLDGIERLAERAAGGRRDGLLDG